MKTIFTRGTCSLEEKKRRKKIILVTLLVLMIGIGVTFCIIHQMHSPTSRNIISGELFPGGGDAAEGHLPKMTEEEIKKQMQREADKSVFSFKINSHPRFEDGSGEGTLHIENPSHNIYPFVVEIFLNETKEKIYDSGGVLPNHHISHAKLSKRLSKGKHAATAYIHAYDPETNKYAGKSAVELTLVINN